MNMKLPANQEKFIELLNETHKFPADYSFKFIFPAKEKKRVSAFLVGAKLSFKESKKGNYISVTAVLFLDKAEDVILINEKLSKIEGLLTL